METQQDSKETERKKREEREREGRMKCSRIYILFAQIAPKCLNPLHQTHNAPRSKLVNAIFDSANSVGGNDGVNIWLRSSLFCCCCCSSCLVF